jgi:transcriptional regulator with XRE-family HTH domain
MLFPQVFAMQRSGLIRARQALNLSRAELSEIISLDRTSIWKVENGVQDTTAESMRRWVAALGPTASLDFFLPPKNPIPRIERRERMKHLPRGRQGRRKRDASPAAEPEAVG